MYAWDYSLSTHSDPSWFYFTNIPAVAFLTTEDGANYHMAGDGSISVFRRNFSDFGEAIDKKYRFATQYMGLVFSIVLTSKVGEKMDTASVCKAAVTAVIVIAGAILCGYVINKYLPDAKMLPAQQEMDMNTIGHSLLGTGRFEYILPFEAISVLLLACIIGGILIAKNNKKKEGEED